MSTLRTGLVFTLMVIICCCSGESGVANKSTSSLSNPDFPDRYCSDFGGRGALLLSQFNSFEDLKRVVHIEYSGDTAAAFPIFGYKPAVTVSHCSGNQVVTTVLRSGVSEFDFICAKDSSFWDKVRLGIRSPYAVLRRDNLLRVEILGRRRPFLFGEDDVAFYDLAEKIVSNITSYDTASMPGVYLTEKGYLNTFNHIVAQAMMTSLFSEDLADYIADVHERYRLPQLVTGDFTEKQIGDINEGPVDNYIDLINNEWGQELGKRLKLKYNISPSTHWSPGLLTSYLNDLQSYHSWAFKIGFNPFNDSNKLVIRFSDKLNTVLFNLAELKRLQKQESG